MYLCIFDLTSFGEQACTTPASASLLSLYKYIMKITINGPFHFLSVHPHIIVSTESIPNHLNRSLFIGVNIKN